MVEEVLEASGARFFKRLQYCVGLGAHMYGDVLSQVMDVGGVVHVGVADECGVDVSLLFRVAKVVEIVLAVDSFQVWEKACDLEVDDAVAFPWLRARLVYTSNLIMRKKKSMIDYCSAASLAWDSTISLTLSQAMSS